LEDQPVPDVSSNQPADVRLFVALDVHKLSIVAATLPPAGGRQEVTRIETTEKAIRRFVKSLYRAGLLRFVQPPTPETEGLRDLLRCRDDLRCARTAARHRVSKQLLRHGLVFREGKKSWTLTHRAWVARQRLPDPLAHAALEQMLIHLDGIDRQLAALDARLEQIAHWGWQCDRLRAFRGISTLTALGLIAEIGDFARFGHPRELASWLGITPSEYSSGEQQHRGHITKSGNRHARRLLVEAAWHYRHAPRRPTKGPAPSDRAWQAQIRLFHRHRHLTAQGKRSTVVTVALARELTAFLWAEMTDQPPRKETLAA
jgi:transposase